MKFSTVMLLSSLTKILEQLTRLSILEDEESFAFVASPQLITSGLKKGLRMADYLVNSFFEFDSVMDRGLKFKYKLEVV
jgi:hypothetical protein